MSHENLFISYSRYNLFHNFLLSVCAMKNVIINLIQLPNEIICGGVLLPGQRVISANNCISDNYTNIKLQLPGSTDLFNIVHIERRFTVLIYVSSL